MNDIVESHDIVRTFWASKNILQNPDDLRQWDTLPADVLAAVLGCLPRPSLAAVRLSCKAWSSSVDKCVTTLSLSSWPADPSVLSGFTSLTGLSLMGPLTLAPAAAGAAGGGDGAGQSSSSSSDSRSSRSRILALLTELPRLSSLSLPFEGGEDLPGLAPLTRLTHISLVKPCPAAAASGSGGGAVPDPDEAVDWLLPGLVPAGAAAPGGEPGSRRSTERFAGSLPASLGGLSGLVSVSLEGAGPDYRLLRQLQQLRCLELRGQTVVARGWSKVAANPLPGVGQLGPGLTALVARSNFGIKRLPPDIGALAGLAHLDVSKNMLFELPAELSRLTGLTLLDASSNCLTALPDCISCLAGLMHLDASNNSRVVLPAALGRLGRLAHLALNWTWAEMGPLWQAAPGLSSLTNLSLVGNGISELPATIGAFTALSQLCLSMNNLTALPEELGCLGRLVLLDAADNRLASLPAGLGRLSGLASLGLRSNCLAALPAEVAGLAGLTNLDVSMNQLAALPDGITCLTGLEQLALSMNPLGALPAGMTSLRSLKILEMYYVKLAPGQQGQGQGRVARQGQGRAGSSPLPAEVADAAMDAARCLQAQLTQLYIFSNNLPGDGDEPGAAGDCAFDNSGDIARVLALSAASDRDAELAAGFVAGLALHDSDDDDNGGAADERAALDAAMQRDAELHANFQAVLAAATRLLEGPADLRRLPHLTPPSSGSSSPGTTGLAAAAARRYELLHAAGGSSRAAAADGDDAEGSGGLEQQALPSNLGGVCPGSSRASSDGSWITVDSAGDEDEPGGGSGSPTVASPAAASPMSHPISSPSSGSSGSGRSSVFSSFCVANAGAAASRGAAVGEAADRVPDLLPQGSISDLRKQQKKQQQQLLASLANSSSSNWCQLRHTAGGPGASCSWPFLPAAAAADPNAGGGGSSTGALLSGTWSCDLGMLAAAKAAASASAAGASAAGPVAGAGSPPLGNWAVGRAGSASAGGAAGGGAGRLPGAACAALRPLRPLSQAHSLGRPLLSRYSRGGEATGSPTISSGYGLPARLLAPTGSLAAAGAAAEAPVAPPAEPQAGGRQAGGAETAGSSPSETSSGRPARRDTQFDDQLDAC